jgi:serine/threonine-protein kinase RsbW
LVSGGLCAGDADDIELSLVEALNNVIEHSYQQQPDHKIQVECTLTEQEAALEIRDTGIVNEYLEPPVLSFDPEDISSLPERSMGRYLIYTAMDLVDYFSSQGINTLVMKKALCRRSTSAGKA